MCASFGLLAAGCNVQFCSPTTSKQLVDASHSLQLSLAAVPQTHAAAINLALHPAACGLCLLAVCADSATCPPDKAAAQPLVVVDDCGSCAADQILVAPAAFK